MEAFSDYYQVFLDPIGTSSTIFDFEDGKMENDVTNYVPDRAQYIMFSPGDGLAGSDSFEGITTQAINLPNGTADNALQYLYESTMESLGLQEIINPAVPSDEQVAAAAFYAPSVGVGHGERPVYPVPKSTEREEMIGFDANHLLYYTPGDGSGMEAPFAKNNTTCWKMKNRKTDPDISKNVFQANAPVPLKKSNRGRCKPCTTSSASRDRGEKSNPELDVIRRDRPELLSNIVTKEQRAESPKDYIHVRARRGQATDNHSLAERVRRKKINDRMDILKNLVPGCNKITNKALMLEEIINYVYSLQKQAEILSLKLATISPIGTFHHRITGHPFKELLPLEATTNCMVAYETASHDVEHS